MTLLCVFCCAVCVYVSLFPLLNRKFESEYKHIKYEVSSKREKFETCFYRLHQHTNVASNNNFSARLYYLIHLSKTH